MYTHPSLGELEESSGFQVIVKTGGTAVLREVFNDFGVKLELTSLNQGALSCFKCLRLWNRKGRVSPAHPRGDRLC